MKDSIKRRSKRLLVSVGLLLLSLEGITQNFDLPKNSEVGKCYGKCVSYTTKDTTFQNYYIPKKTARIKKGWLIEKVITFNPKYHEQISSESNGTYTLLLNHKRDPSIQKIEFKTIKSKYLKRLPFTSYDSIKYTTYWKYIPYEFVEWEEVLCGKFVNQELYSKLGQKLKERGFLDQNHKVNFREDSRKGSLLLKALIDFQSKEIGHKGQFCKHTFLELGLNDYFKD